MMMTLLFMTALEDDIYCPYSCFNNQGSILHHVKTWELWRWLFLKITVLGGAQCFVMSLVLRGYTVFLFGRGTPTACQGGGLFCFD